MSDATPSDDPAAQQRNPTEAELTDDELRAAYDDELKRIRVDDVLIQTVVSLLNLAARRAGLTEAAEEEVDFAQVAQAIEATRALLPLVEPLLGAEAKQVRDALSQLQLAYARSGAPPAAAVPADHGDPAAAQEQPAAPARSSGRLWVPGQ
jgi:hypothetical protein